MTMEAKKLDGLGPVDNRPSTDKLYYFVRGILPAVFQGGPSSVLKGSLAEVLGGAPLAVQGGAPPTILGGAPLSY